MRSPLEWNAQAQQIAHWMAERSFAGATTAIGAPAAGLLAAAAGIFEISLTTGPGAIVGGIIAAAVALAGLLELFADMWGVTEDILKEYDPQARAEKHLRQAAVDEAVRLGYPPHLANEIAKHIDAVIYPMSLQMAGTYWSAAQRGCAAACSYRPNIGGFWGRCCRDYAKGVMWGERVWGTSRLAVVAFTKLLVTACSRAIFCCEPGQGDPTCCYLESKGGWYTPADEAGIVLLGCDPCGDVTASLAEIAQAFSQAAAQGRVDDNFGRKPKGGGGGLAALALLGVGALVVSQA